MIHGPASARDRSRTFQILILGVLLSVAAPGRAAQSRATGPGLRIVVVEGEDAVNIVQQKTAVAPVVEVRDRNNQPVAGALVRFGVRGGRATFGGGTRALSITTNAAGRAAATGFTPTATGAVQISVSASFEGQTAVATIVQTNVLTAAQSAGTASGASTAGTGTAGGASGAGSAATSAGGAVTGTAAAGGAAAAGAAAAGGAAGAGAAGGISAATIGIVGGAAAGGTLVAVKAAGGSGGSQLGPASGLYSGTVRLSTVRTAQASGLVGQIGAVGNTCTFTLAILVTLTLDFDEDTHSTVTKGHFETTWTETTVSRSCPNTQPGDGTYGPQVDDIDGQATSSLHYTRNESGTPPGGGTRSIITAFSGSLSGDAVVGTFTIASSFVDPSRGVVADGYPATSGAVTLQKRGQ